MTSDVASRPELDPITKRLWGAIWASVFAFAFTGALGWFVAAAACTDGTRDLGPLSNIGVRLLIGGIAVAGLLIAGWGAWTGYREWRVQAEHRELEDTAGRDRYRFLALAAMLVSTVFLLGILWEGLPTIFIDICEAAR